MTQDEGKRERRHPDAVAYLEGLTESEAAVHPPVIREDGDGFVQYWLEGGEVRSRGITKDDLPLAGFRPGGLTACCRRRNARAAAGRCAGIRRRESRS